MSIETTWDLQAKASPKSLTVYPAVQPQRNPFDKTPEISAAAVVFGTDQGSLHYRTYTLAKSSTQQGPLSNGKVARHYLPMDLNSLPAPVVACIAIHGRFRQEQLFLLLLEDGRSSSNGGVYASMWMASSISTPGFHPVQGKAQPRMSCACFDPSKNTIFYGAGPKICSINSDERSKKKRISFDHAVLPAPGIRSGQDALVLASGGRVAVVAVANAFYAVAGRYESDEVSESSRSVLKILSLQQSSQVHPIIITDLQDESLDADWSSLFLASGRECGVVDICLLQGSEAPELDCSKPRHGTVTVASPILSAAASWPWVAFLQSDGLISIRSPSCLAISLRTVEVGQRPNDFFSLRTIPQSPYPWIVCVSYSGECKVLQCQPDSTQDLADRLMRHAIDAFGANGFPRAELGEAVNASFTATSYVGGPEVSPQAKVLLKQYLEAVLGLSDFESGASSGWPIASEGDGVVHQGTFADIKSVRGRGGSTSSPAALLTGTAMLCLVCSQLQPPNSVLASRAAKTCAEKMGIVNTKSLSIPVIQVCEMVVERLLREASSKFSLGSTSSSMQYRSSHSNVVTDFIEAAIWLLRSCGKHERAIDVAYERLQADSNVRGYWSQIKYESYTATHLSEIWSSGQEEGCKLVLSSPATHRLLENNPRLGLSVFTAMHPQNEAQWRALPARDDPLVNPDRVYEVLRLLKSISPSIPCDKERSFVPGNDLTLPLESGRAVAVSFLRSGVGISSGRPVDEDDSQLLDEAIEMHRSNFHDELSFLLLEGVIAELPEDESKDTTDTELGHVYRSMLREFLNWPLAKIRTEQFMESLPPSFLQEKALVLGRVGSHEDALRILYRDLKSLDLALEYCDDRFARQKAKQEAIRMRHQSSNIALPGPDPTGTLQVKQEDNAYLPLVRVALESDDTERGTEAAIKVLALRRSAIDRAAALRLLPSDVPVSAVARPFLIPALVDSESQVRRMTVVSALLRSRYLRLKEKLTEAQLKAQANIHVVPALRSLNLGDPLHSTMSFRARTTSSTPSSTMPYVEIVKHFFPRHLVIQAKVTNAPYSSGAGAPITSYGQSTAEQQAQTVLTDVAFVVAESSEEEAIQPMLQVPIQVLPPKMTGSAWCVLSAAPGTMDGPTAQLTCELRYSVQSADAAAAILPGAGNSSILSRTFVEELHDLEVHASHFS